MTIKNGVAITRFQPGHPYPLDQVSRGLREAIPQDLLQAWVHSFPFLKVEAPASTPSDYCDRNQYLLVVAIVMNVAHSLVLLAVLP
jgi:hypothetical protein